MSRTTLGYLYLTLAMMLAGSTVVASKIAAAGLPPFTATALRFALALPCFLVLLRVSGPRLPRPGLRDGALLVVQGLAGTAGYTALLMAGLRATSALDAGVILGTLPVVSSGGAVCLLGGRAGPAVLATVASQTASGHGRAAITSGFRHAFLLGAAFAVVGAVVAAIGLRTQRPVDAPGPAIAADHS